MASDRKSIERTVCNPAITPSPNEETIIQSFSLYLNKTDFQPSHRQSLFKPATVKGWDVNTAVYVFMSLCCFILSYVFPVCCWTLKRGLKLTENRWIRKGNTGKVKFRLVQNVQLRTRSMYHEHEMLLIIQLRSKCLCASTACFWEAQENQCLSANNSNYALLWFDGDNQSVTLALCN